MVLSFFRMLLRNSLLIAVLFIATYCERDLYEQNPASPYSEIENKIRARFDSSAVYTWDSYKKLLDVLSRNKFRVLTINEMRTTFDNTKVIVGLRHDVDFNPFKALEMAKIEEDYGIRSTYFFLATSEYAGQISYSKMIYNEGIGYLYKDIYRTGKEIGIHNNLISVMIEYNADPFIFNSEELAFYRSLRIPVYGTAAHGSPVNKETVPNFQIFSDFATSDSVVYLYKKYPIGKHSLKEYGFQYEAYHVDHNKYFSDSGGMWNDADGFEGIIAKLLSSQEGDRIQILVHPEWYGSHRNKHL